MKVSINFKSSYIWDIITIVIICITGEDYIQVSERILIAGNQTTDINILIINDDLAEGVESIGGMLQVLSPQSNASSTITIEIIDDEGTRPLNFV